MILATKSIFVLFYIFISILNIYSCGCCAGTNFRDNDFCFLQGQIDKNKVLEFENNSNHIMDQIKAISSVDLINTRSLFNKKSKQYLKNSTNDIAVKNFMCLVAINYILAQSYHLLKCLNDHLHTMANEEEDNVYANYKKTEKEYLEYLDKYIKKTLSHVIGKNEEKVNLNDFIIKLSRESNECFTKYLYVYVYKFDEKVIDNKILDCMVSYKTIY